MIEHAFSLKLTCLFTYVYLIFTLCFTCVHLKANTPFDLFKPVIRHLYSLAFYWESYHSKPEQLDLRQYLATGNLSVFEPELET